MTQDASLLLKIRLRQLRCFVTVAREKSFVHAADRLGLTQPAVSRSIRELETLLGEPLFDRSMRGAELTPRGKIFFESTQTGLAQISQGVRAVNGAIGENEVIRIGALPNVCSQFLPRVVQRFKTIYPQIVVRIISDTNLNLMDNLRRGDTDVVIGRLSTSQDMRGLAFETLYDEPLIFVTRSDHPLAGRPITLQNIIAYPLLLPTTGTIIHHEAMRFLAGNAIASIPDIVETTSSDFQRAYINTTDCVAIVPRGVVEAELDREQMVRLPINAPELSAPVGLTRNPDTRLSDAILAFIELIRNAD